MANIYKILQLYAKDIYANTEYDGKGNKKKSKYKIDIIKDGKLSSLFRGSMNDNLDINAMCNKFGKDIIKEYQNQLYLTDFISVCFKGKSLEYSPRVDYEDKKKIYVKRGYTTFKDVLNNLEDSVYIKDGIVIAVKVENEIKEINQAVIDSKYFKVVEKDNIKYYSRTNKSTGTINSKELREGMYKDGFSLELNGKTIEYVRYKRSASNARIGNCLFINKEYYDYMSFWSHFENEEYHKDDVVNEKPVEDEAYRALSLSSLEKFIELNPYNILILKDEKSIFNEECINVDINDQNELVAKKETTTIENTIWDGEGLLDKSIFDKYGYENKGMLLLRNRYFKSCVFNTNLQKWFKDKNITSTKQLNGYTEAERIEDILMVVTESSMKILKFSDSTKPDFKGNKDKVDDDVKHEWMKAVGNLFGVVKTDKPTHRFGGRVVRTSYQILNTLSMNEEEIKKLVSPSLHYLNEMKENSSVFKFYLNKEVTIDDNEFEKEHNDIEMDEEESTDTSVVDEYKRSKFKICSKLLSINNEFEKTILYSEFRTNIIEDIKKNFKKGRLLIPGTYATIFGNGYELLLATIGEFKSETKPLIGKNEIICKFFEEGKDICAARFPHVTMGNLYWAKNIKREEYDRYFNLSKEIVCVNAINENIQQRLNGMDYDSDTMLVTDFEPMVEATKKNYDKFLVPVCKVKSQSAKGKQELYDIDNKIANNYVGRITNLSQHLNSILWDKYNNSGNIDEDLYMEICKLAILSGMEIDKAKRDYNVDSLKEYNRIRESVSKGEYHKIPDFMYNIKKDYYKKYNLEKEHTKYNTLMGEINVLKFSTGGRKEGKVSMHYILNMDRINKANENHYQNYAHKIITDLDKTFTKIDNIETKFNLTKNNNDVNYFAKNNAIKEELDSFYLKYKEKLANPHTIEEVFDITGHIIDKKIINKIKKPEGKKTKAKKAATEERKKASQKEIHLWPLLYILNESKTIDNKNMLTYLFGKDKTKDLVEDSTGDIDLFGIKYKEV